MGGISLLEVVNQVELVDDHLGKGIVCAQFVCENILDDVDFAVALALAVANELVFSGEGST